MKIRTKVIALALASALAAPNALAVEGSDGMHYTSASEGFYASVRLRFNSGGSDKSNASIGNQSSRLGVQGTGEMSHGLEGFYRYEAAFSTEQGNGFSTRLGYVGIRGGYGSFRVGSDWSDSYNWVTGSTDIANVNSGNFNYNDDYSGRSSNAFHYQSPDFNGMQVAARFDFDGGSSDFTAPSPTVAVTSTPVDAEDSELDAWELSAKYSFAGFTVAGTYLNRPDYLISVNEGGLPNGGAQDKTAWAVRASYGQDNWNVATWYGENNASDYGSHVYESVDGSTPAANKKKQDETVFSVAGNVTIGKSGVYVVHESKEDLLARDNSSTAFGIEYRLNSKSKVWIEYAAKDYDSDQYKKDGVTANNDRADDYVTIGLRHDF